MKRLWRKLVCIVIGHNIDVIDDYATECFRCGLTFDWEKRPREDIGFWLTYCNMTHWWRHRNSHKDLHEDLPF